MPFRYVPGVFRGRRDPFRFRPRREFAFGKASVDFYQDLFERTVGAGNSYGTADIGSFYTPNTTVTGATVSVSGGAGRITPATTPKTYHQALENIADKADVTMLAQFSFSAIPTGANMELSVYCRSDVGSNSYYAADVVLELAGTLSLSIEKNTTGARTDIASPINLGAYTAGDKWWVELTVVGTDLEARCWKDGTSRPSTAQQNGSDSSYTTGKVGLRSRWASGNTNTPEIAFWEAHGYPAVATGAVTTDSGTGNLTFTASGTDVFGGVDAATISLAFTPTGVEFRELTEAATASLTFTPTGIEVPAHIDAGLATITWLGTAVEFREMAEAATAALTFTASAVEVPAHIDAATASLTFTATATLEEPAHYDAATATLSFTAAATIEEFGKQDSATVPLTFTATATETGQFVDAALATLAFTASAVEVTERVDAAQATLSFTASAVEIPAHIDAATANLAFTPSGTDAYSPGDAAVVPLTFTATGVEFRTLTEADTVTTVWTASALESVGVSDAALVNTNWVVTGVEQVGRVDSATVGLSFTATGTDFRTITDAATANATWLATASESYDQIGATVDGTTVTLTLSVAFLTAPGKFFSDTFEGRSVAGGGWGTASDGHTYTMPVTGTDKFASVQGGAGSLGVQNNGVYNEVFMELDGVIQPNNFEFLAEISFSHISLGNQHWLSYIFRRNGTTHQERVQVTPNLNNSMRMEIHSNHDNGVDYELGVLNVTAFRPIVNQHYYWRVRRDGATTQMKIWYVESPEPVDWQLVATTGTDNTKTANAPHRWGFMLPGAGDPYEASSASTITSGTTTTAQIWNFDIYDLQRTDVIRAVDAATATMSFAATGSEVFAEKLDVGTAVLNFSVPTSGTTFDDDFTRTTTNGFGGLWGFYSAGTDADYSTDGAKANIVDATGTRQAKVVSVPMANGVWRMRTTLPLGSAGGARRLGPMIRSGADGTNTGYWARLNVSTANVITIELVTVNGGAQTVLATGTLTNVAAGDDVWIEISASGTDLAAKCWRVVDPEPANQISASDSTFTTGVIGIRTNNASSTAVTFTVDRAFGFVPVGEFMQTVETATANLVFTAQSVAGGTTTTDTGRGNLTFTATQPSAATANLKFTPFGFEGQTYRDPITTIQTWLGIRAINQKDYPTPGATMGSTAWTDYVEKNIIGRALNFRNEYSNLIGVSKPEESIPNPNDWPNTSEIQNGRRGVVSYVQIHARSAISGLPLTDFHSGYGNCFWDASAPFIDLAMYPNPRGIVQGDFDDIIEQIGLNYRDSGIPFLFCFHHEPGVHTVAQGWPSDKTSPQGPAAWAMAFNRWYDIWQTLNIWNCLGYVFNQTQHVYEGPFKTNDGRDPAHWWDPLTFAPDFVGADGYCAPPDPFTQFTSLFLRARNFAVAKGKPLMIGEVGYDPDCGNGTAAQGKGQWYRDMETQVKAWNNVSHICFQGNLPPTQPYLNYESHPALVTDAQDTFKALFNNERFTESTMPYVLWQPSGTEVYKRAAGDFGTANLSFTASAPVEQIAKFDVGTAQMNFTARAPLTYIDTFPTTLKFTASGVEFVPGIDAATATMAFATQGVEIVEQGDAATSFLTWSVSDQQEFATGDFATALIKFFPDATEIYTVIITKDHLLELTQAFPRWQLTEAGSRFYALQEHKYEVAQTDRWIVTYMGRGLLSEVQRG